MLYIPWLVIVLCLSLFTAPSAFCAAATETAPPATDMTRAEFEARVAPLAGLPVKANEVIRLSDAALAGGAKDDPGYAALAHGYKSHALWLRNDFLRAEAEARESVHADPGAALGYFFLADALNGQLRYDDAYLACLHGAERRGDPGKRDEARTRCREDYARRVTMDPAGLIRAVRSGRIPVGGAKTDASPDAGYVFISGRITTIRPGSDEIEFSSPAGTVVCRLSPSANRLQLAPVTGAEAGRHSSAAAGLRAGQLVTLRGVVRSLTDAGVTLDQCEIYHQ